MDSFAVAKEPEKKGVTQSVTDGFQRRSVGTRKIKKISQNSGLNQKPFVQAA